MQTSETIGAIAAALAKAQGEIANPAKNRTVKVKTAQGSYDFSYATFDAILETVRPILAKNGIAFIQSPDVDESGKLFLETTLSHSSGEWMRSRLPVIAQGNGPQAMGSALSYAKRYALSAMVGIAADEDDDGNTAEGNHVEKRDRQTPPATVTKGGGDKIMAAKKAEAETFIRMFKGAVDGCPDADAASAQWKANSDELRRLKADFPGMYEELVTWCKAVGDQRHAAE